MFTILEFHNISNQGIAFTKIPSRRFSKILDILIDETVIVPPSDFQAYLAGSSNESPQVMLSFDDGYEEVYTNAYPLMRERALAGMVSVVAGYVGKTNSWDIFGGRLRHLGWSEIGDLVADGWYICSHTMTHPDLKRCSDDRLVWELTESKILLEDKLGTEIPAVAYPFGRFNMRVLKATHQAGYRIGFTVGAEVWQRPRIPLTTLRIPVYQTDSDALIRAKVKPDGFSKCLDAFKNRTFNKLSLATSFVHRNRYKEIPRF
ncbi:polysaccharide deacetylase family protein [candidate division WOR-3 bacterium]|nr:polysaccharide deacetylase family protein [candidate division WOR-3 bacterium]